MAWIESHQTLSRHRKTLKTAGRLSVDRHKLIGHLHELWWWGLDNVGVSGVIENSTSYEIATAAQWDGDPDAFVEALVYGGFIDRDGDKLQLHDWYEYAGQLIEKRIEERDRSRRRREEKKNQGTTGGQPADGQAGDHTADHSATDGRPMATVPYPTVPNTDKNGGDVTASLDREPTDEEMNNLIFGVFGAAGKDVYDQLGADIAKTSKAVVALALREAAVKAKKSRPKYYRQIMVSWGKAKTLADVAAIQADHGRASDNAQAGPHTPPNAREVIAEQKLTAAQIELYKRAEAAHRTAS